MTAALGRNESRAAGLGRELQHDARDLRRRARERRGDAARARARRSRIADRTLRRAQRRLPVRRAPSRGRSCPACARRAATIDASFPWIKQTRELVQPGRARRPGQGALARVARPRRGQPTPRSTLLPEPERPGPLLQRGHPADGRHRHPRARGPQAVRDRRRELQGVLVHDGRARRARARTSTATARWCASRSAAARRRSRPARRTPAPRSSSSASPRRRSASRPVFPGKRPPYRPDVKCHTQPIPNLNSARVGVPDGGPAAGGPDTSQPGGGSPLPPVPGVPTPRRRTPACRCRAPRRTPSRVSSSAASTRSAATKKTREGRRRADRNGVPGDEAPHPQPLARLRGDHPAVRRSRSASRRTSSAQQRFNLPAWVPGLGQDFYVVNAEFQTAKSVTPGQGQTVTIAGVNVGELAKVELKDGRAIVQLKLKNEYGERVRKDATLLLRPKTGLEDMVVEMSPGSGEKAPEGWTIPVQNTLPTVQLDEILASLDRDTRDYLRLLVAGAGQGLDGAGDDLAATFKRFEPGARVRAPDHRGARRAAREHPPLDPQPAPARRGRRREGRRARRSSSTARTRSSSPSPTRTRTCATRSSSCRRRSRRRTPALRKTERLANVLGPTLEDLRPTARALGPTLRQVRPVPDDLDADHPRPAAAVRARRAADGQEPARRRQRPRRGHARPARHARRPRTTSSTRSPTTRRARRGGLPLLGVVGEPHRHR